MAPADRPAAGQTSHAPVDVLLAWSAPRADVHVALTTDEAARVSRMRREVDRAGHATARRLATDLLHRADPTLIGRSRVATLCDLCGSGAHGRPQLEIDRAEIEWQLSWAHSDRLVVVALAAAAVGVDTEPSARAATLSDDLGALLPHPPQGRWPRLPPQARLQHWVRIEAVRKAAGLRLSHAQRARAADYTSPVPRFRLGDQDFHVVDGTLDGQLVAVATDGVPRIEAIPGFGARHQPGSGSFGSADEYNQSRQNDSGTPRS